MLLKYFGKRIGGYIKISGLRLTYYFYSVKGNLGDEKVLAKVITNG